MAAVGRAPRGPCRVQASLGHQRQNRDGLYPQGRQCQWGQGLLRLAATPSFALPVGRTFLMGGGLDQRTLAWECQLK